MSSAGLHVVASSELLPPVSALCEAKAVVQQEDRLAEG
jgi:hypothetical protein